MSRNNHLSHYSALAALLVLVGLLGYIQPWIVLPTGSMTLGAFDLAEWASLLPAQRATSPPLLAPLLLRLQPVILCLILGAVAESRATMAIAAIAILLLAAAQLPPFEYVYDINNLNYRQQFFLAIASLIGGIAAIPLRNPRLVALATIVLPIMGLATSVLGLAQAEALYRSFQLGAISGAGIVILSLSYLALLALSAGGKFSRRQAAS
ncbi:MAG: hypothetical protein OXG84_02225 [Chloroflexi bacterium]|nr:hypothetical protein [Chloroflexota bacterium]